jgi:tetratricopeptide (TPR) repeat protein
MDHIHSLYLQMLNWSENRLARYFIAHEHGPDRDSELAVALALLERRFAHDPSECFLTNTQRLTERIVALAKEATDGIRHRVVDMMCDIAGRHIESGLDRESSSVQLVVRAGAQICLAFESEGLELAGALHSLQKIVGKPLEAVDLHLLLAGNPSKNLFIGDQQALADADRLKAAGRFDDAMSLYLLALVLLERQHPEHHPEVLACMEKVGDIMYSLQMWKDAAPVYLRLEGILRGVSDSDVCAQLQRIVSVRFKLAKTFERAQAIDDALLWYEKAVEPAEQTKGHLYPNLLDSYAAFLRRFELELHKAQMMEGQADERRKFLKNERRTDRG